MSHVVTLGVTESSCILLRPVLQRVMKRKKHPLISHLKSTGESLASFAKRTEMSRMQLYRIMDGENTTLDRIKKISAATKGAVPISVLTGEVTR